MKSRNVIALIFVLLAALVALWWWAAPKPPASAPPSIAASPAAKFAANVKNPPAPAKIPPVPKSPTIAPPVFPAALAAAATAPAEKSPATKPLAPPLTQEQRRAVTNNLRQIASASMQYMLDHGVTEAGYYDVVGTGPNAYLRPMQSAAGESYEGIILHETDTQVEVSTPDGGSVTFNM